MRLKWPYDGEVKLHTGIRCPHHNCREIGQSRFSPSQLKYCCACRSGKNLMVPSRTTCSAGSANGAIFTNHWSDRYGWIAVLLRSENLTLASCGFTSVSGL